MEKTKIENNYEETIVKSLIDSNRRGIFLALYDSSGKRVLSTDELLPYVEGDISKIFPQIEDMSEEGLVEHGWRKKEGDGTERTYTFNDDFYNACHDFNENGNKIIERFASFCIHKP